MSAKPVHITPREHAIAELRAFLFNVVRLEMLIETLRAQVEATP